MMNENYDAIVVGARCAGSPLAMLLARQGHRVLLLDRATFPSDTVSTHVVHPRGMGALARWGLAGRLIATGCPPVHTYAFDFGPFTISGSPAPSGATPAYCPRRTVLDQLLVDAAREAGVEVREGFSVDEVSSEDGRVVGIRGRARAGGAVVERASIVIGADGRHSAVAQAVSAERYHEKPPLLAAYYSYWSGVPMHGRFETYVRPQRGFAAVPTHDDLTLVIAGWPFAELAENKRDVEGNFLKVLELAPEFAERVRRGRREARFAGAVTPNFFRKPFGPGWALVGDAGYCKDPITAQGISDAFHDAERCAAAVSAALLGVQSFEAALGRAQQLRDEQALPLYEFTCQLAMLAPPPPELQQLLGAVHGRQEAMDAFVQMNAGSLSPAEFFSPAHVAQIMGAARRRAG
jgi:2-polyprenyl-6-methoxyphenol hydroxylase-like FAD-dependent oxidoreductase